MHLYMQAGHHAEPRYVLGTRAPFYTIVQKRCCALGIRLLYQSLERKPNVSRVPSTIILVSEL